MDAKTIRQSIGKTMQVECDYAHVIDSEALKNFGVDNPPQGVITRQEAVDTFNQASKAQGLPTLYDPTGYMTLDDNTYETIKDIYDEVYNTKCDNIEGGYAYGTLSAMEGVLDKLDATVGRDIRSTLRDNKAGVTYSDLRFVPASDDIIEKAEKFADVRSNITAAWSVRRQVEPATRAKLVTQLNQAGSQLSQSIQEEVEKSNTKLGTLYNKQLEDAVADSLDEGLVR